jgi:hypothetical protein
LSSIVFCSKYISTCQEAHNNTTLHTIADEFFNQDWIGLASSLFTCLQRLQGLCKMAHMILH